MPLNTRRKFRLSRRQEIAFQRPCYVAEDCANPRYHWRATHDGRLISVNLTLNVGLE